MTGLGAEASVNAAVIAAESFADVAAWAAMIRSERRSLIGAGAADILLLRRAR